MKFKFKFFASALFLLLSFTFNPTFANADVVDFQQLRMELIHFTLPVQHSFIKHLSGKTLLFSNGLSFKLGDFIGAGETTAVFELRGSKPPKAIRIPFFYTENEEERAFINEFIDGAPLLNKYAAPVVQIYDSHYGEYVVVERLPENSLNQERLQNSNIETKRKAAKSLIKLAAELAPFNDIGDFKMSQLHYDPKEDKWILADWADNKNRAGHYAVLFNPQNPNDHFNNEIQRELLSALGLEYNEGLEIKKLPDTLFNDLSSDERMNIAKEFMKEQSLKRSEWLEKPHFITDAAKNTRLHQRWTEDIKPKPQSRKPEVSLRTPHPVRLFFSNCIRKLKETLKL